MKIREFLKTKKVVINLRSKKLIKLNLFKRIKKFNLNNFNVKLNKKNLNFKKYIIKYNYLRLLYRKLIVNSDVSIFTKKLKKFKSESLKNYKKKLLFRSKIINLQKKVYLTQSQFDLFVKDYNKVAYVEKLKNRYKEKYIVPKKEQKKLKEKLPKLKNKKFKYLLFKKFKRRLLKYKILFGKKKYLKKNNKYLINYYFLEYYNSKFKLKKFNFKLKKKLDVKRNLDYIIESRKQRNIIKNFLRNKDKSFFGNLHYKSYNFNNFYKVNENRLNIKYTKIDLKSFYNSIEQPYKFGFINIALKKNNIFVNLSNKHQKIIYNKSGGALDLKGSKKKTFFGREKVVKHVALHAMTLNYKVIDVNCKFFAKRINFHITKALREADMNIRFYYIKKGIPHGTVRAKKLRRK